MSKVDERKRSSDCFNDILTTNRPKRRKLELGPLVDDAYDAKKFNLDKLPPECLHRVLSFVTYDKVSQLRQVSKVFNKAAIKVLHEGHKELEGRLVREIKRAEKRKALFSINVRSSNDTLRFLNGLHKAINNCAITYWIFKDYFVAGKLLDEANCLLQDLDTSAVVPYLIEHVYDLKPHPLLGPISADSQRAFGHFKTKILYRINWIYEEYEIGPERQRDKRKHSELIMLYNWNHRKIRKTNLLENLRRKVNLGNEVGGEMLKMIFKLNEHLLELTHRAKTVDQEVEMVVNCGTKMTQTDEGGRNCLFSLSSFFNSSLGDTKGIVIPGEKRANLATLPSSGLRNIFSYLNLDKTARMRQVCASFKKVCEEKLNEELEKVKQEIEFQIEYYEKDTMYCAGNEHEIGLQKNIMKDLRSLLRLCEDNYKRHLGTNFCFVAGKVLEEAEPICQFHVLHAVSTWDYESRPHSLLFRLMDLAYQSIAHFKFTVAPEYFPATQHLLYVPDFLTTGESTNVERESQLKLEEIEALVEEAEAKVKEQNIRNGKCLKIIFGLKKKVSVLNDEISEKINVLKNWNKIHLD